MYELLGRTLDMSEAEYLSLWTEMLELWLSSRSTFFIAAVFALLAIYLTIRWKRLVLGMVVYILAIATTFGGMFLI